VSVINGEGITRVNWEKELENLSVDDEDEIRSSVLPLTPILFPKLPRLDLPNENLYD
jgi:hypothetical protein